MAKKRKTRAEKEQERYEAKQREWERFKPILKNLQHYADAKLLLRQAPRPDTPGRGFYTNLGFFLDTFSPPGDASMEEKTIYIELIKRWDEAGDLKPGVAVNIEKELSDSMVGQYFRYE